MAALLEEEEEEEYREEQYSCGKLSLGLLYIFVKKPQSGIIILVIIL
jgi:hypothetical protein